MGENVSRSGIEAVYEAADGLPKSLNVLGRAIAMNAGESRRRINVADVIRTATKIPKQNIRKFSSQYPQILGCAKDNPVVREVLVYLYHHGIGQIHHLGDIVQKLEREISEEQIRNAIGELINLKFLTQTGFNNDILFVTNPTFAHTLGVVAAHPEKYDAPRQFKEKKAQLYLPLFAELGDKK